MNFKTSRKEALEVLENYVEKEITKEYLIFTGEKN